MTRLSGDEWRWAHLDGFDYALQVWVTGGVVQRCDHPISMSQDAPCCPAFSGAGRRIDKIWASGPTRFSCRESPTVEGRDPGVRQDREPVA
jgi:hypothetical protein